MKLSEWMQGKFKTRGQAKKLYDGLTEAIKNKEIEVEYGGFIADNDVLSQTKDVRKYKEDSQWLDWNIISGADEWYQRKAAPKFSDVPSKYKPSPTAAPLYKAITDAAEVVKSENKEQALTALKNLVDVYSLSQFTLRLPRLEGYTGELPEGYVLEAGAKIGEVAKDRLGIVKDK